MIDDNYLIKRCLQKDSKCQRILYGKHASLMLGVCSGNTVNYSILIDNFTNPGDNVTFTWPAPVLEADPIPRCTSQVMLRQLWADAEKPDETFAFMRRIDIFTLSRLKNSLKNLTQ